VDNQQSENQSIDENRFKAPTTSDAFVYFGAPGIWLTLQPG
jgi:hypothetical protein